MTNVVRIGDKPGAPDDKAAMLDIIDQLRAGVEDGTVAAFAVAKVNADGTIGTQWHTFQARFATIGAVAVLMAEMTGAREQP